MLVEISGGSNRMKYPVFAQALALTIVVFVIGLYIGVVLEDNRLDKVENYYLESEIYLMDVLSLNNLIQDSNISCTQLKEANFDLVNRVYGEAVLLEKFEKNGQLDEDISDFHKKYDILRTYLWIDAGQIREKCGNFNSVVYIYNNSDKNLATKAKQNVLSNILYDLKEVEQDNVLLISLDVGADLVSLNTLLGGYEISEYPVIIINEKIVLEDLKGVEDIKLYIESN